MLNWVGVSINRLGWSMYHRKIELEPLLFIIISRQGLKCVGMTMKLALFECFMKGSFLYIYSIS
uniref:Uncharacterized protein n=1 Tax=Arundo donax TaxID=35708 RepID=A0A0A9BKF0_ARUDO